MEIAPAGMPLSFEVTFDQPNLFVAMAVLDTTTGAPVLVQGPVAMPLARGNTYFGVFTPQANRTYVIQKAVYTDGTFTTLNPEYSQGSESIVGIAMNGGPTGCTVIGYVNC